MDKRQLENAWGETSVPVIAFEAASLRPVYENPPARLLSRGDLLAALNRQDALVLDSPRKSLSSAC